MSTIETPTTELRLQLSGWGEFEGSIAGSCRAMILGQLIKLAAPHVKAYHSDFYHDAIWDSGQRPRRNDVLFLIRRVRNLRERGRLDRPLSQARLHLRGNEPERPRHVVP